MNLALDFTLTFESADDSWFCTSIISTISVDFIEVIFDDQARAQYLPQKGRNQPPRKQNLPQLSDRFTMKIVFFGKHCTILAIKLLFLFISYIFYKELHFYSDYTCW